MDAERDDVEFFRDLGFDVRIEEHDLHAEHMAAGEPGRASFFAEGRTYFCVEVLSGDGRVIRRRYAHGETAEDALANARRRFGSEER